MGWMARPAGNRRIGGPSTLFERGPKGDQPAAGGNDGPAWQSSAHGTEVIIRSRGVSGPPDEAERGDHSRPGQRLWDEQTRAGPQGPGGRALAAAASGRLYDKHRHPTGLERLQAALLYAGPGS